MNTRGADGSEPADWGGVNVKELAVAMGFGSPEVSGCVVMGVWEYADVGVSGYVIENGPGVCVRWDGCTYSLSALLTFDVSSRKKVGFPDLLSDNGLAVFGDEFSMAAAYAFDKVLNAVGDEGSISAFNAVTDFPRICGVAGVLI